MERAVLIFLVGIGGLVGTSLLRGLVLCKLWAWFLVEPFGFPAIGVALAIGLSLLVSLMTWHGTRPQDKQDGGAWAIVLVGLLTGLVTSCLALFMGWIIHLFV